ncbi:MAG: STAS domain-containing protein [Bacteriovoracaceae bacterium]
MTIKSKISIDVNGNVTVEMTGGFNYEYGLPLNKELARIANKHQNINIMIDLNKMEFVGSSGIGDFVATLNQLQNVNNNSIKLINVHSEFQKVFKLYNLDTSFSLSAEIQNELINEFDNDETDVLAPHGKRTFQN